MFSKKTVIVKVGIYFNDCMVSLKGSTKIDLANTDSRYLSLVVHELPRNDTSPSVPCSTFHKHALFVLSLVMSHESLSLHLQLIDSALLDVSVLLVFVTFQTCRRHNKAAIWIGC